MKLGYQEVNFVVMKIDPVYGHVTLNVPDLVSSDLRS